MESGKGSYSIQLHGNYSEKLYHSTSLKSIHTGKNTQ